ncbi:hypothetical protein AAFF_G00014270 [Aldrovandia affinis]|uniref:Uncharacterized protein n=1 Tax=Aldrovandia affinis TaxID=143900 RepID=A0AAD7S6Q6_9TELE|nr:hypothetical protein AAFF_G00014270 [Aldrovandia affinis]
MALPSLAIHSCTCGCLVKHQLHFLSLRMLHIWDTKGFSLSHHLVVPSGQDKPPAGTVVGAVLPQLLSLASFSLPVTSLSVREEEGGADREQVYLKLAPMILCSCVLFLLSGVGQEKQAAPLGRTFFFGWRGCGCSGSSWSPSIAAGGTLLGAG